MHNLRPWLRWLPAIAMMAILFGFSSQSYQEQSLVPEIEKIPQTNPLPIGLVGSGSAMVTMRSAWIVWAGRALLSFLSAKQRISAVMPCWRHSLYML